MLGDEPTAGVTVSVDDRVATLRFSNPEKRGAFTPEILTSLRYELDRLAQPTCGATVAVLRGSGGVFSSGYAIDRIPHPDRLAMTDEIERLCAAIETSPLIVLAMLESFAIGAALDVAAACDLRFAGSTCRLGITPAKLGLVYTVNGTARIHALAGPDATRFLFYTAELVDAATAQAKGLVTQVHDDAELETATYECARAIAARAPLSLAGSKQILHAIEQHATDLDAGTRERLHGLRRLALGSSDAAEARAAFAERRPPRFTGEQPG